MLRSSASPATSSTQHRVDGSVANSHESRMNSAGLLLIHRSAWNRNSPKFISKILHSPARTRFDAVFRLIIRCIQGM
jgi:hypothetical protein